MGFLIGILVGLGLSLVVARTSIWQGDRDRNETDCERLLAAEEARREQLRERLAAGLDPGPGGAPQPEPSATGSDAGRNGPAPPPAAVAETQPEPPTRPSPGDSPRTRPDGQATPATGVTPPAASRGASRSGGPTAGPDDLRKIEGVGPKIAGLLNADGIDTFESLAAAEISRLQRVLDNAGSRYRLADPTTWPEQAALAAAGDWDGLRGLQEALKGGRRV